MFDGFSDMMIYMAYVPVNIYDPYIHIYIYDPYMVTINQPTDRTDLISERFHLYQTFAIPDIDTAVHDPKSKSTQTFCGLFCDNMTKDALYRRKKMEILAPNI